MKRYILWTLENGIKKNIKQIETNKTKEEVREYYTQKGKKFDGIDSVNIIRKGVKR